jgi:hypothetical protein
MTTLRLSHEQAFQLRMISVFEPEYYCSDINDRISWAHSAELIELGCRTDETLCWRLTDTGKQALAAYDAEFVTVRREDVAATVANFESHSCCASLENVAANFRAVLEVKC